MADTPSTTVLFSSLIAMLHQSAMMQLGKIKNPVTDAIERDLQQARLTIDLLIALRDRSANNRTPDEDRLIDSAISDLQLNYVDEVNKG